MGEYQDRKPWGVVRKLGVENPAFPQKGSALGGWLKKFFTGESHEQ